MIAVIFWIFFPFLWVALQAEVPLYERLFADLEQVEKIDAEINDQLPLSVNYLLQGGYLAMPSARTFDAGLFDFGFSYLPPYRVWSLGLQFFDRIETTGNYWIYSGIVDSTFGHLGFGEEADRAANAKFILLRRQDGFSFLPDLAMGWNDLIGTCRFSSFYAVVTKEWLDANLETTLGWGNGRIQGFFGGAAWSPWRRSSHFWRGITFKAEYDANNYKHHAPEHPSGRTVKSRVNGGVQVDLWDCVRASVSTLRGTDWAAGLSFHYNLGQTDGIFPKYLDVLPYVAPVDTEPLGLMRTEPLFGQELLHAFKEQGFDLYTLRLQAQRGGNDILWMRVVNSRYRTEVDVRTRIEHILASLNPSNVNEAVVVVEAGGVPLQEYVFQRRDLQRYRKGRLGEPEFTVLSPMREVSAVPSSYDSSLLYQREHILWMLTFRPWMRSYFGSSTGKFKYQAGFAMGSEGYLWDLIYYTISGSYTAFSSIQNVQDSDILNPSRLINVRTDTIRYHQANSFHLDTAFLQRSWNLGGGWFGRLAAGYFETAYAGIATEALYYPVDANWAVGAEVATVLKRRYSGIWYKHKIRKLTTDGARYFPFVGLQYFVDFYYDYKPLHVDFRLTAGQFLARDKGIRMEAGRLFHSGLRLGLWYAFTNGNDVVNEKRYYDKGFSITMPLDIFMNQSSRTRIGYSMAAWLRDIDARAATGNRLYPTLYDERYSY